MKKFFVAVFGYNRRERSGLIVLFSIVLILFSVRMTIQYWYNPDIDSKAFDKIVAQLEKAEMERPGKLRSFYFDPNEVGTDSLQLLGLNDKQASVFLNFRKKVNGFKSVADIQKLYCLREDQKDTLCKYAVFKIQNSNKAKVLQPGPDKVIELNSADSLHLVELNGIGPVLASRILKFRKKLGGFYKTEQLLEVYGLEPTVFYSFFKHLKVDPSKIKRLDINSAGFAELISHPYLHDKEVVKSIFKLRKERIITQSDLENIFSGKEQQLGKILPYLSNI